MTASWTIQQLGEAVEARLAGEQTPANGQVRAVPDERSIRYYTTLGLLDRPTMRGRQALYEPRHLAQLITIKRMQAAGQTLAEIQRVLPGFDDAELARRSGVTLPRPRRGTARREFWRLPTTAAHTDHSDDPHPESTSLAPPTTALTAVLELELAPGVRLAFQASRPATDADAAALLAAAATLLTELTRRHLVPPTREAQPASPEPKDRE